jgi:maleylacetoacetate isomerase/maleylpyruvate isomerase
MKLYTFFRSSASYRVRIALNLKGIAYEAEPVHFRRDGGEHRTAGFLEINPQGLLPVLEDQGEVLTQSLAIIDYLDATHPEPRLIPLEPLARARVYALAEIIACEIHPLNNLRVLRYLSEVLCADAAAVRAWYQHWVAESFAPFEALLRRMSGRYCYGDAITLADVCLVPQVYNARRFECDLTSFPLLVGIAQALEQHEAFTLAAPEHQPDAE